MSQKQNNTSIFQILEDIGFTIETFYVRKSYCDLNLLFKYPDIKKVLKSQFHSLSNNFQMSEILLIVKEVFKNFGVLLVNDDFSRAFEIDDRTYRVYFKLDLQNVSLAFPRNCCLGYKDTMFYEVKEMIKNKDKGFVEPLENTELVKVVKDRFELLDLS